MSDIVEQFAAVRRQDPQRQLIFLPESSTALTAADLWRRHEELLPHFERLPLQPGDLLVCGVGNRPELLAALLACRRLECTMLAVDTGATSAEMHALCARFGAKALLSHAAATAEDHDVPVDVGGCLTLRRCEGEAQSYRGAAVLKLTSGSTGSARAVLTPEAALIADGRQIMDAMTIHPDDTQLVAIPIAHSYGLGVVVAPLLLQGTPIILRDSFIPQRLGHDASRFGARRMPGVPFMFEYFVEHPPVDGWPAGLTQLVSAGARLEPTVVQKFHRQTGLKIHSFYGTSETGGISFDAGLGLDTMSVGRPLPGVSLSIRTEEDLPGGTGRVHVRSEAVAEGYVGIGTAEFIDGGFLTGDLGQIAPDGQLMLSGRVSSFINVAGRKVQPDEVERVLRDTPGIAEAWVTGAPDPLRGEKVVAFVVPRAGVTPPDAVDIRRRCSGLLAAHKIPRLVLFVEAIPLNARGKTDRAALMALLPRSEGTD